MKTRKTKYDDFVLFDPKKKETWVVFWDHKVGKQEYYYMKRIKFDKLKKLSVNKVPKNWQLLARLPEKTLL